MIDVSKHIQRLEWLKEWMVYFIDNKKDFIFVDIDLIPTLGVSELLRLFFETGILYSRPHNSQQLQLHFNNFYEFVNFKEKYIESNYK